MSKPKVSIIIPTFNVEKYIDIMIDSVLKQTLQEWELILIDDGSTDSTIKKIFDYAARDNRIKAFRRDRSPKGSVTCRNIGQEKAQGKYFIHFDSDDIIEPFCLAQRVVFMDSHPEVEWATFKGQSVREDINGEIIKSGQMWGVNPHGDLLKLFLSTDYPFSVWNNIYRASSFKNYFWDEKVKIYTDFSYIVPALIEGKKHSFDDNSRVDYLYRQGQSGAMTTAFISDEKYKSTMYLFAKTFKELKSSGLVVKYKNSFKKFYILHFQRVLINGSQKQINDFYGFFTKYYPNEVKMKIIYFMLRGKKEKRSEKVYRKEVMGLTSVAYNPSEFIKWFKSKGVK